MHQSLICDDQCSISSYCDPSRTDTNAFLFRNARDPTLSSSLSPFSTSDSPVFCRTPVSNKLQQSAESSYVSRSRPNPTSSQFNKAQFIMTTPTSSSHFPDISNTLRPNQLSADSAILTDSAPFLPSATFSSTTTQPTSTSIATQTQSIVSPPAPNNAGLSNSALTAVIVVPIVLLAILSPMLILWFISWRRKRRHRSRTRPSAAPEARLLESEKEKSSVSTIPPQERWQEKNSLPKRSTASLPPPRREFTRDFQRRRSAHQLRTSRMPNSSLSGFNFDFSRRATVLTARSTQPTVQDSILRPSSTNTWILPPFSTSRPMSPAQASLAPPIETSGRSVSPPQPQNFDQVSDISPRASSGFPTTEVLARPDSYGNVHLSSSRPLSDENLSVHNGSNVQYPFSQPYPDAVSDVSGLSFDYRLWIATQRQNPEADVVSEVSAIEQDPPSRTNPHQIV